MLRTIWQTYQFKNKFVRGIKCLIYLQQWILPSHVNIQMSAREALQWPRHLTQLWRCLLDLNHLKKTNDQQELVNYLNQVSEIFFSLHQLQYRIQSPSLLETCHYEISVLSHVFRSVLLEWAKGVKKGVCVLPVENFLEKVYAFEAVHQQVLQIVTPGPIIFSFFLQDLYAIAEKFQAINDFFAK